MVPHGHDMVVEHVDRSAGAPREDTASGRLGQWTNPPANINVTPRYGIRP